MRNSLILQDKNYISARRVQELFGYSSDYVGQLCRLGKIEAKMIGRTWFVTEKSIIDHKLSVNESIKEKSKEKRKLAKKIYKDSIRNDLSSSIESSFASIIPDSVSNDALENIKLLDSGKSINSSSSQVVLLNPKDLRLMPNVPELFSLPYFISESFLISPNKKRSVIFSPTSTRLFFSSALCVIGLFFMIQSVSINTNITNDLALKIGSSSSANVLDSSGQFIKNTFTFIKTIPVFAKNIFINKPSDITNENANLASNESDLTSNINDVSFGGLAVVPSSNSEAKDEIIKNKIKESFSDKVIVKPDRSGTSGIITPVFRETKGSDFIYVLVPVNDKTK